MKTRLLLLAALLTGTRLDGADPSPKNPFVVHEWGTFTDVQGADGVQMEWNPLIAPDLPKFVYDRQAPVRKAKLKGYAVAGKTGTASRQRMETPVIYFYSDRPRTVEVAVRFPEGMVTEWYPHKAAADLNVDLLNKSVTKAALRWEQLQMVPSTPAAEAALPKEEPASHYYAARDTDACLVQTQADGKTETEKFLFYRGLGDFKAPLTVKVEEAMTTRVVVQNWGQEPLRDLYLYQVRADGGSWIQIAPLKPGERRFVKLPERSTPLAELAVALRASLVRDGLYEKEADAMIKTWESSWFAERGLRVLYTLPRAWTDRILPLKVTPAPQKVERVMVARAEVILPASERALRTQLDRYIAADDETRPAIVADTRALGLGRFIEPAMRRVMLNVTDEKLHGYGNSLVWQAMHPAPAPAPAPSQPSKLSQPLTEAELLKVLDGLGKGDPAAPAPAVATVLP